jgi:uncharacterized DUF497 family protein
MEFAWSEAKNAANSRKHGLKFELAALLFRLPIVEEDDDRRDYGELRVRAYGKISGRLMVCIYTDRWVDGRSVRWIISLRKANQREVRRFDGKVEASRKA